MSVALNNTRHKDLITDLIVADISPAKGPLSNEFTGYIKGMQEIEKGQITSRKEADALLKAYEPVTSYFIFITNTNILLPHQGLYDASLSVIKFSTFIGRT